MIKLSLSETINKFYKPIRFTFNMNQTNYDEYGNKLVNEPGDVTFKCPNCGKAHISRSKKARQLARSYTCPSCGFVGP